MIYVTENKSFHSSSSNYKKEGRLLAFAVELAEDLKRVREARCGLVLDGIGQVKEARGKKVVEKVDGVDDRGDRGLDDIKEGTGQEDERRAGLASSLPVVAECDEARQGEEGVVHVAGRALARSIGVVPQGKEDHQGTDAVCVLQAVLSEDAALVRGSEVERNQRERDRPTLCGALKIVLFFSHPGTSYRCAQQFVGVRDGTDSAESQQTQR